MTRDNESRLRATMSMMYPSDLLDRLVKEWGPPHHRPLHGASRGVPIDPNVVRQIVTGSFFASLRTEEGQVQSHGVVLVQAIEQLAEVRPPWHVHRLETPLALDAERIAKVAGLAADDDAFLIVAATDPPMIVGFGQARESGGLVAADRYPRIRAVAPGDLVFYRGDSAVFRYRAGQVEELRPDFFVAGDEPREALIRIGRKVFSHWENDEFIATTKDIVAPTISSLLKSITSRGRGGMLAVLAPDEEPKAFLGAAAYPLETIELGEAIVAAYESSMLMNEIEQRTMGPDYRPARLMTADECESDAEWRDARDSERRIVDRIGAMAGIDGAVLMTAGLNVLSFGCKLPGIDGERPHVLRAPANAGVEPVVFDLTTRGTRHAAAAVFAETKHGRLAFTVSADGPAACFMWSERFGHVVHWPVHVGVFAPTAWDTAG